MRSTLALPGLLLCVACSDATAPPCEAWGGCLPGSLVVRFEILDSVFPAQCERAGVAVWGPGDTIAVLRSVENQSDAQVDSFILSTRSIPLKDRPVPPLGPGERVQFIDTFVAPFTDATEFALRPLVVPFNADTAVRVLVAGDTIVPVLSTGSELGLAGLPGWLMMEVRGRWDPWVKWRLYVVHQVLVRVSNPYEAPLAPFRLTWQVIPWGPTDLEVGAKDEVEALTPEVPPGESRDTWIPFTLRRGPPYVFDPNARHDILYADFWEYQNAFISICRQGWLFGGPGLSDNCADFRARILPDFEAECTVIPTIVPGDTITDDTRECGDTGSAYRFTAHAGEHYRVDATPADATHPVAFIVGRDGQEESDPRQTEIAVWLDGDYYVIVDQQSHSIVTFTLVRL